MKTLFTALAFVVISSTAFADFNLFDDTYADCTDYGHSIVTEDKHQSCIAEAKAEVLDITEYAQAFQDCIEYGHKEISAEEEVQCLREASQD